MTPNLQEINTRLADAGLAVRLDAQAAERLKRVAPRTRVLNALGRVEAHNDTGARAYLEKTLRSAGLLGDGAPPPARAAQALPVGEDAPEQQTAPAQSPKQAAAHRSPSNATPTTPRAVPAARQRAQHHVYGGRAALTFELDETPAGAPTVALDGAVSVGERKYDWQNKIRVQFTTRELPVVAATLLGILPECQFSNHGPANDKGFQISWQSDRKSFFVKVWQGKGNLRAVPMPREDAFYAAQLLLRAIQQASPARLDTAGVIATLRAFYGRA